MPYFTERIDFRPQLSVSCIGDQTKSRPSDSLMTAIRVG